MRRNLVFGVGRLVARPNDTAKFAIWAIALCFVSISASSTAWAAVLSSEPFADPVYTDGTELPTLDPTIAGYTGAWTDVDFGDAEAAVIAGSLDYTDPLYLPESGNRVGKGADSAGINAGNCGRVFRLLDSGLAASDATDGTLYLSWLFQTGNENAADNADTYQTLALYNSDTGDGNRNFDAGIASGDFGTAGFAYRVENNAGLGGNLNVAADSGVHLFVAKFELSSTAASDSVTVWLDPTLGGVGDPAGGVTVSGIDTQFDRLALSDYASNSSAWDEIRWGDTFASVTSESFLGCDVNSDNLCNSVDFGIIRDNMFTNGTRVDGDLSGDGVVDLRDYRLFKDDPNRVVGGALAALGNIAVPEPSSLCFISIVSLSVCLARQTWSARSLQE